MQSQTVIASAKSRFDAAGSAFAAIAEEMRVAEAERRWPDVWAEAGRVLAAIGEETVGLCGERFLLAAAEAVDDPDLAGYTILHSGAALALARETALCIASALEFPSDLTAYFEGTFSRLLGELTAAARLVFDDPLTMDGQWNQPVTSDQAERATRALVLADNLSGRAFAAANWRQGWQGGLAGILRVGLNSVQMHLAQVPRAYELDQPWPASEAMRACAVCVQLIVRVQSRISRETQAPLDVEDDLALMELLELLADG